jgi:predicted RNA binding protein YcfA (HicA-like mRNA interferase family)
MSSKLPSLKPSEVIRALGKAGIKPVRQTGSHVILWKEGLERPFPIPLHNRTLKNSLRDEIIKQAGLTPEEFRKLL